MIVKPAADAPMNEHQLRTVADMIPGVLYRFYARRTGEGSPVRDRGAEGRVPVCR